MSEIKNYVSKRVSSGIKRMSPEEAEKHKKMLTRALNSLLGRENLDQEVTKEDINSLSKENKTK